MYLPDLNVVIMIMPDNTDEHSSHNDNICGYGCRKKG